MTRNSTVPNTVDEITTTSYDHFFFWGHPALAVTPSGATDVSASHPCSYTPDPSQANAMPQAPEAPIGSVKLLVNPS